MAASSRAGEAWGEARTTAVAWLGAAYAQAAAHPYAGLPGAAAGALDPRAVMSHQMLSASIRPPNPFDPLAAVDPFRAAADPYHRAVDMFGRDPLREARERELLMLSEYDRAKALQMAGYSSALAAGYYPPTSLAAGMHHKMAVPPHLAASPYGSSAAGVPPTLGLPSLGLGPHPLGLNGAPPPATPTYGKDLLRR